MATMPSMILPLCRPQESKPNATGESLQPLHPIPFHNATPMRSSPEVG